MPPGSRQALWLKSNPIDHVTYSGRVFRELLGSIFLALDTDEPAQLHDSIVRIHVHIRESIGGVVVEVLPYI